MSNYPFRDNQRACDTSISYILHSTIVTKRLLSIRHTARFSWPRFPFPCINGQEIHLYVLLFRSLANFWIEERFVSRFKLREKYNKGLFLVDAATIYVKMKPTCERFHISMIFSTKHTRQTDNTAYSALCIAHSFHETLGRFSFQQIIISSV